MAGAEFARQSVVGFIFWTTEGRRYDLRALASYAGLRSEQPLAIIS
jgi:hypothetical protein